MTSGGKKDPTYIDDVFSTYLWKGTGSPNKVITNGIKLGNANAGNSVKFSGSSGQLEVASTSDFAFGTDPFTIEFWLFFQSVTDYCAMFEGRPNSGNGNYLTFGFASAQITGTVSDSNGEPLAGANVVVDGRSRAAKAQSRPRVLGRKVQRPHADRSGRRE